ncbi:MAG: VOC family protein [Myxococcales bacterium]|nr:VOC family protein [Myxococcales bacterium]
MTGPPSTLGPRLVVVDAASAIDFYVAVFGAVEQDRIAQGPEGPIVRAQLAIGRCTFCVSDENRDTGNLAPPTLGGSAVLLELEADPDAVAERATARGADILIAVDHRAYGRRDCRIRDPFGHLWIVGRNL